MALRHLPQELLFAGGYHRALRNSMMSGKGRQYESGND